MNRSEIAQVVMALAGNPEFLLQIAKANGAQHCAAKVAEALSEINTRLIEAEQQIEWRPKATDVPPREPRSVL